MTTLLAAALAAALSLGRPTNPLRVTAENTLAFARPSQTIELTRAQLAPLGERDLSKIHVRTAAGRELVVQPVDTDFDDLHAPDIVIFQSDFAPHERKEFVVDVGARQRYTPADYRAYGRFVRERFDDFAWENDRIAHRTYGEALESWKGEPLTSSAIDIWSKLGPRLIVNEWYMMGDAFYHDMTDNGGDDYTAGATRGDGGAGVWADGRLWAPPNFVGSRELANGPIRVLFELDYPAFTVGTRQISEVLRVSLDAGSQLDHYRATFSAADGGRGATGAVGLKKVAGEHVVFDAARGVLTTWQAMEKRRGMEGLGVIVDPARLVGDTADAANTLVLVRTADDGSVEYWAGFAWDRAGVIGSDAAWQRYVDEYAAGVRTPIVVQVSGR